MPIETVGGNTSDDYAGCDDNAIVEGSPTTNNEPNISMEVSKYAASDHQHTLIRFTGLSGITGPVTVSSATLYLYLTNVSNTNQTIAVRRVLRNWVPAQATWNIWSTSNNWTTAGALGAGTDRVSTATATSGAIGTSGSYKAITGLAADVEGWINGTFSNYGWHLERADGANDESFMIFDSSDGSDGQKPYLEVNYTLGGGGGSTPSRLLILGVG